jgi:hypothetical protein
VFNPPVAHGSPAHRAAAGDGIDWLQHDRRLLRQPVGHRTAARRQGNRTVNRIIWLVGLVVIILFILGYFGLR